MCLLRPTQRGAFRAVLESVSAESNSPSSAAPASTSARLAFVSVPQTSFQRHPRHAAMFPSASSPSPPLHRPFVRHTPPPTTSAPPATPPSSFVQYAHLRPLHGSPFSGAMPPSFPPFGPPPHMQNMNVAPPHQQHPQHSLPSSQPPSHPPSGPLPGVAAPSSAPSGPSAQSSATASLPPPPLNPPPSSYRGQPCQNWLDQLSLANIHRQSGAPHHNARAAHLQSRVHTSGHLPSASEDRSKPHRDSSSPPSPNAKMSFTTSLATSSTSVSAPGSSLDGRSFSWTALDLGGMSLKLLSEPLFAYRFLTTLYVAHNSLVSLPPSISKLRHLISLDASGNQLSSLPPELGLCSSLKELLLFDNRLSSLPGELGSLFQLDILGIDGNPLADHLRVIAERDGTHALIATLRDHCPVPPLPPNREWISVEADDPFRQPAPRPSHRSFTVYSHNVLCQKYATPTMYAYTPSWALNWDYRKDVILRAIESSQVDVLCLQEVDRDNYENFLHPALSSPRRNDDDDDRGSPPPSRPAYESVYEQKSRARTMSGQERQQVDGCAIFWNSEVFALIEHHLVEFNQVALNRSDLKKSDDVFNRVMIKDNIAVVALLERRDTGARLIVANTHIHWDPEYKDVKVVQAAMLMDELMRCAESFAKLGPRRDLTDPEVKVAPTYDNPTDLPLILCGDFNSVPSSGVYEYLTKSFIAHNHPDFEGHTYGTYTTKGITHPFQLRSAYASLGELPSTNFTPGFEGVIDYVFYTPNSLSVQSVLAGVEQEYMDKCVGFPNPHFPSDHIALLSELKFR